MTYKNAKTKMAKFGEVTIEKGFLSVTIGNLIVSTVSNGRVSDDAEVICHKVRRENDHDDSRMDYSAGRFFDTLTAALKYAVKEKVQA